MSGCCDCVFVDSVVVLRVNSVGVMLLYYLCCLTVLVAFPLIGECLVVWW